MVKLGEVASYINGYAFKPEDRGSEGLPIIRIQDLTGNSYDLGYYSGNYPKKIEINDGDILISWSASLGVYIWNKGKALLNQHIFKVEFIEDSIDKKYFVYAVRKKIDEMIRKSHGATMKHIIKKDFEDTIIPYPTLEEQYKISDELDRISKIIDLRKQELELYDGLIRARFVELFGYPLNSTKGWLEQRLGECCVINPKKNTDNRLREDLLVSFIPMASVSEKGDILKLEDKFYRDVKNGFTYFCDRDVLFAKITPCMENGKGTVAVGLKNGIGFGSTEFHVLRPIIDKSNSYWLYTLTSFEIFRKKAEKNMTGSAGQKRVPASFLENIQVSVPPINIQNEFEKFVIEIEKSKVEVQKALDKAKLLFDSLMQKYFG